MMLGAAFVAPTQYTIAPVPLGGVMNIMKWIAFFFIGLLFVVAAPNSEGAEYDYPGQVYNTITTNSACYSSKWWYDADGAGPMNPSG